MASALVAALFRFTYRIMLSPDATDLGASLAELM